MVTTLQTLTTPRELAAQLRVSTETVYRLIRCGQIEVIRIGGQYRIRGDVVERLLDQGQPVSA